MPGNQTIDKATIVNWALTDLGQRPTYSIDIGTNLGGIVDGVWPRVVDRCFYVTDWSFCRRTSKLAGQSTPPQNGWRFGFSLPGDRLGEPLKIMNRIVRNDGDPLRNFDIEGDTLYADEPDIWARCKVYRDPVHWDPGFRSCFVTALAGYLAVPVLQDASLGDEYLKRAFGTPSEGGAGGLFGRLIAQHRSAKPLGSPILHSDPLTAARW